MNNRLKSESIWRSYIYGLPFGLLATFFVFSIPVMLTGEGLATMALVAVYGSAILALIISFIVALYIGGIILYKDNLGKKNLLISAIKYSTVINTIIWGVFTVITILTNLKTEEWFITLLPIPVAFFICITITPFTIGLWIAYKVKQYSKSISIAQP